MDQRHPEVGEPTGRSWEIWEKFLPIPGHERSVDPARRTAPVPVEARQQGLRVHIGFLISDAVARPRPCSELRFLAYVDAGNLEPISTSKHSLVSTRTLMTGGTLRGLLHRQYTFGKMYDNRVRSILSLRTRPKSCEKKFATPEWRKGTSGCDDHPRNHSTTWAPGIGR